MPTRLLYVITILFLELVYDPGAEISIILLFLRLPVCDHLSEVFHLPKFLDLGLHKLVQLDLLWVVVLFAQGQLDCTQESLLAYRQLLVHSIVLMNLALEVFPAL